MSDIFVNISSYIVKWTIMILSKVVNITYLDVRKEEKWNDYIKNKCIIIN